jgi:dihydrofolate reductase
MICAIVAMSKNRVIGRDGGLPWHLPEDLKRVSKLTIGHVVLMGRSTFESLPRKFRPLPRRISLIVSSSLESPVTGRVGNTGDMSQEPSTECSVVRSVGEGIEWYQANRKPDQILWIFGGASIYEQTLDLWDEVYLTFIEREVEGDRMFPEFESSFHEVERQDFRRVQGTGLEADSTSGESFSFIRYTRSRA